MNILSAPAGALHRDDEMRLFVAAGPLAQAMADATRARLTRRVYTNYASTEASSATVTEIVSPEVTCAGIGSFRPARSRWWMKKTGFCRPVSWGWCESM